MITDSLLANGTIQKIRMDENQIEMVVETALQLEISYKRLFKLLIDKDMTQRELSDQSGVSYLTLIKMRKGEGTIRMKLLYTFEKDDKPCPTILYNLTRELSGTQSPQFVPPWEGSYQR